MPGGSKSAHGWQAPSRVDSNQKGALKAKSVDPLYGRPEGVARGLPSAASFLARHFLRRSAILTYRTTLEVVGYHLVSGGFASDFNVYLHPARFSPVKHTYLSLDTYVTETVTLIPSRPGFAPSDCGGPSDASNCACRQASFRRAQAIATTLSRLPPPGLPQGKRAEPARV